MRRGMLFGIGVAVVLVGGGTAYSAIPSSDGAFHGCVNNATGVLRVIDTSKGGALGNCILSPSALKETPIAWNGQGVAGARGPAGPQGEAGAQGERGPAGPAITDLAELEGIACTVAGRTGTVHITVDTSGSISMNCAPVSQCSDGVDNDADGLVDAADPDCASASDDNEASEAPVCVDDFPDSATVPHALGFVPPGVTTTTNGTICPGGDLDWFSVTAAAHSIAQVSLTPTTAGDVNLCLLTAPSSPPTCSTNLTGTEVLNVTAGETPAAQLIEVLGAPGSNQIGYRLVVTDTAA